MSILSNVTIDFNRSPRLINIPLGITSLSIQDLHDTLRSIEDDPRSMSEPKLISSAGKENLGGGVQVGVTSTLNNAQIAFKSQSIPAESGTATSSTIELVNPTRILLIDTAATFQTNNIDRGSMVYNNSDNSVAEVLTVDSEIQLTLTPLKDGTSNTWTIGNNYEVFNIIQVNVTGGNLVAVDFNKLNINPIFQTAFTQVIRTSSSSATIAALEIEQLKFLIESRRPHHSGFGKMFFVDPTNGNDTNEGNSSLKAFKTLTKAIDTTLDFNNDVITLVAGNASGQTILNENVIVNKNDIYIRGPGRGFKIIPLTSGLPTIKIDSSGVELSSLIVETASGGSDNAIEINSDFCEIRNVWVENVSGTGIHIMSSNNTRIVKSTIQNCINDGITVSNNSIDIDITNSTVSNNNSDAVHIVGTGIKNVKFGVGTKLFGNAGYGINIGTGVTNTVLTTDLTIFDNILGEINDLSNSTGFGGRITAQNYGESIHIDAALGVTGTIFPRGTTALRTNNLTDARNIANRVGIVEYKFHTNLTLNADHLDWNFTGKSSFPQVNINNKNVNGSKFNFTSITGTLVGMITSVNNIITNIINLDGIFITSAFEGTNTIADNASIIIHDCVSKNGSSTFDFANVTTAATVDFRGFLGDIDITNFTNVNDTLILDIVGKFTLNNTNTAGNIVLRGNGEFVNNSSIPIANINTISFINNITTDAIKKDTALIPGLV